MLSYQIDVINPKADKLLQDLAELQLIAIRHPSEDPFLAIVRQLREKAASNPPMLEEITQEVEAVRAERFASGQA